jgi:hypothetical protein
MTGNERFLPVKQRALDFYGDNLTAIRANDDRIYAGLTQMCHALGLDPQGQRRRIERHAVMSKGLKGVDNLSTPGGTQSGYVLRVDLVPLWLSGIRVSAVKEDVRPKLKRFQEEAATVLWEAFQEGRLTADPTFDELLQNDSDAVQAYKMAAAIMKLARTQIMLEARLDSNQEQLTDHEQRLEQIETQLGSGGTITPDQATAISQAVKTVARALGKQSGRNEYGGVYGELYRRYRIPSYRELPAAKYDDAINWLGDWLESLAGDEPF